MSDFHIPTVETERLILRRLQEADLDIWAQAIFADPDVMRYIPQSKISPRERAERTLQAINRNWEQFGYGNWAVTDKADDRFIGHCGLNYLPETDEVEIDYAFAKTHWGKGIGTEAAYASLRYSFENLKQELIIGLTIPENIASRNVLEKLGFVYQKNAHYFNLEVNYYTITPEQFDSNNPSSP